MSVTNNNQEDFPIYRIMSIYEFYELYVNHKLKLTLFDNQKDKNDGIEYLLTELIFNPFKYVEGNNAFNELKNFRKNNYMTCWTKNSESIAMWSLYSTNLESIRVRTTKEKLSSCLIKFIKDNHLDSQWKRPSQKLVTEFHLLDDPIQEAEYKDLRKLISEIKEDKPPTDNVPEEKHTEILINWIKELKNKYSYLYKNPIKDESYSYEQEIRGRVKVGLNVLEQYKTYEEWMSSHNNEKPIRDNQNTLPLVQYADTKSDFIDEICFDPRMPSYKKNSIIDMMKIDKTKIVESKCFTPAIDLEFNLF